MNLYFDKYRFKFKLNIKSCKVNKSATEWQKWQNYCFFVAYHGHMWPMWPCMTFYGLSYMSSWFLVCFCCLLWQNIVLSRGQKSKSIYSCSIDFTFVLFLHFLAKSGARWAQLLPVGARPAFNILGRCRKTIGRKPCWMPRQRSRIGRNRGTPSNGGQNLQAESQTFTLWTRKSHGWTESWKHGKKFMACQFMACQCMACQCMDCQCMACQCIACQCMACQCMACQFMACQLMDC